MHKNISLSLINIDLLLDVQYDNLYYDLLSRQFLDTYIARNTRYILQQALPKHDGKYDECIGT